MWVLDEKGVAAKDNRQKNVAPDRRDSDERGSVRQPAPQPGGTRFGSLVVTQTFGSGVRSAPIHPLSGP